MIALGAIAERSRLGPTLVFIFIWATIVYGNGASSLLSVNCILKLFLGLDPIACWTWNKNGWSFRQGSLDFAGGTPSTYLQRLGWCVLLDHLCLHFA